MTAALMSRALRRIGRPVQNGGGPSGNNAAEVQTQVDGLNAQLVQTQTALATAQTQVATQKARLDNHFGPNL